MAQHDSTRGGGLLAVAYSRLGNDPMSRAWGAYVERTATALMQAGSEYERLPYALARVRAAEGRNDDALQMLEEAVDRGFCWHDYLMRDPSFSAASK